MMTMMIVVNLGVCVSRTRRGTERLQRCLAASTRSCLRRHTMSSGRRTTWLLTTSKSTTGPATSVSVLHALRRSMFYRKKVVKRTKIKTELVRRNGPVKKETVRFLCDLGICSYVRLITLFVCLRLTRTIF